MGGLMAAIIVGVNSSTDSSDQTPTSDGSTDRDQPKVPWVSATGSYRFSSVAADAEICSQIGTEMMARKGGSAVDAAIAAMLCIGVANPHSTGIGGGCFMTIYEKPNDGGEMQKLTILGRETAPAFASEDMYVNDTTKASLIGGKAIAVPGEIRAYHEAWMRFGKVSWKQLFEPTIKLAKEGFPVSPIVHDNIHNTNKIYFEPGGQFPLLRETFTNEDGTLVVEGDILRRPKLARTLERIAEDAMTFYNGTLAKDIVKDIADQGGNITLEDLENYSARIEEPLKIHLRNGNYTLLVPQPPSGGIVLGHILKVLDGYNFDSTSDATLDKAILLYHRIVEAFKFAFARRSELGDPMTNNTEILDLVDKMMSDNYTEYIKSQITDDKTHPLEYYNPVFDNVEDAGTSHLSILSPDGAAVSITSTINIGFGSKVVGNTTGIIFNDEMDDFSTPDTKNIFGLPASPANYIAPGKRPLSSMSPAIVLDGSGAVRFVSGASGGPRIITSTAMACIFGLWLQKDIQGIADTPRLHHQLSPEKIFYQSGMNLDLLDGLESKGHEVEQRIGILAVVQNILNQCEMGNQCTSDNMVECLKDKCIKSSSDGAKAGAPDGY